jgi:SlyX protein
MVFMESRIVDLEIRVTHQEAALQQLSDVLVQQQKLIDRLTGEVDALKEQMRAQAAFPVAPASEETPPPHY